MPAVSVVIPSFNRGHLIRACLASVLAQSFRDLEVIVVDDASTDDTREQVLSMPDSRVRYIAHTQNQGGAAARNTGIRASGAEFVAFLDSDDIWEPLKLEKQIRMLGEKGDDFGFVYTWFVGRRPDGMEVWRMDKTIEGLAQTDLLIENCIGTFSSVVARRAVLNTVGGLDVKMRSCQDWDLFVRLNEVTKVCCVEEYLVQYIQNRNDANRISASPKSVLLGHRRMLQKIERRFPGMSAENQVASLTRFSDVYVSVGAVTDAAKAGLSIISIAPSFRSVLTLVFLFVRTWRRILTRNVGY